MIPATEAFDRRATRVLPATAGTSFMSRATATPTLRAGTTGHSAGRMMP
jgi:hypothetical protein